MHEIKTVDVNTWEEFEVELKELCQSANHKSSGALPLLFRGQEDSGWPLNTTLDRSNQQGMAFAEYFRRISKIRHEIESVTDRKWKLPEYSDVFHSAKQYDFSLELSFGRLPAYPYMAYLRHHGFLHHFLIGPVLHA